jgi:hypothetical protein
MQRFRSKRDAKVQRIVVETNRLLVRLEKVNLQCMIVVNYHQVVYLAVEVTQESAHYETQTAQK